MTGLVALSDSFNPSVFPLGMGNTESFTLDGSVLSGVTVFSWVIMLG